MRNRCAWRKSGGNYVDKRVRARELCCPKLPTFPHRSSTLTFIGARRAPSERYRQVALCVDKTVNLLNTSAYGVPIPGVHIPTAPFMTMMRDIYLHRKDTSIGHHRWHPEHHTVVRCPITAEHSTPEQARHA